MHHLPPTTRTTAARRRGFTLLELLMAMGIAAMVIGSLYAAVRIGFRAESAAEAAVEPARAAELSMGLLRADFESAVAPSGVLRGTFVGTDASGDGGLGADTVQFYTLGDPLEPAVPAPLGGGGGAGLGMNSGAGAVAGGTSAGSFGIASGANATAGAFVPGAGEVRMVELLLVPSPSGSVLVRRVTTHLLSPTSAAPYDEVVCRGVRSFNLRYCDGSAWQDSWDSTLMENHCPTAVEVTMELQRGTGDLVKVVPCTRVFLMSCSGLWSPTATEAAAGGTGQ